MRIVSLLLLAGCSIHNWQERRIVHKFERAGLERHTLEADGTTVHYWAGGVGDPLLLLHGFGADGSWCWAPQLPLSKQHRLIVPDLIWFGDSTSTRQQFNLDLQVDAVRAILAHEHIEQTDVAGVSYGGFVAFKLAVTQPHQVRKLVLIDSPGPVFTSEDLTESLARLGVDEVTDVVIPQKSEDVRTLLKLAYFKPPWIPKFALDDIYEGMFTQAVLEKRKLLGALQLDAPQLRGTPWTVTMPTLVLWGAEDPLFPMATGQRFADAIGAQAQFVAIPHTRHAPNLEKPREFNRIVSEFLAPPTSP